MKRILLLGDAANAPYHPLTRVEPGLRRALDGLGTLEVRTDYRALKCAELSQFDMIVSYIDTFPDMGPFEAELAQYIRGGGRVLALHNGIITPDGSALASCYGGVFLTHPEYQPLRYRAAPQAGWLEPRAFEMAEEPYMVRPLDGENEVFLTFELDGHAFPAGWIRRAGRGSVLYLAPGHDDRTTENPAFTHLLRQCATRLLND